MADYPTRFSFQITDLNEVERGWLARTLERPDGVANPALAEPVSNGEFVGFETSFEDDGHTLWLYSEDSGTPEDAANLVQEFLARFRPDDTLGFEWANTCSRPLVDAFGGGAVFITADEQRWMSSARWLVDQTAGPPGDHPATTTWNFHYAVRSSIDDGRATLGEDRASVRVAPGADPTEAAVNWVHDNDHRADPRIQPTVEIISIEDARQ